MPVAKEDSKSHEDSRGHAAPVMGSKNGSDYKLDFDNSSKRSGPILQRVFTIYATEDCYIKKGSDTVSVSSSSYDRFLPKGFMVSEKMRENQSHVAVIRATTNGIAYINGEA